MAVERPGDGGFALVEVLATLAISGAILLALASFVSLLGRQADRLATRAQDREVVARSVDTLARTLERTRWIRWAGQPRRVVFSGSAGHVLLAGDTGAGGTPRIVRLQSVRDAGGGAILWMEAPLAPDLTDPSQAQFGPVRRLPIGDAIARFAFITPGSAQKPEIMSDDWSAQDAMPAAVRLALLDPRSLEIRASVRINLLAGAEPGCLTPRKALCSRFDARGVPDDETPSVASILGNLHQQVRR